MREFLTRLFLVVILPCSFGHVVGQAFLGCASTLKEIDDLSDPSDDAKLSQCRKVGRNAKKDGAPPDAAFAAYRECTEEAGLR